MTKKKQTAIIKELNRAAASPRLFNISSPVRSEFTHFTLIDARELFCRKNAGDKKSAGNLILKIIYLNKNTNQTINNNN